MGEAASCRFFSGGRRSHFGPRQVHSVHDFGNVGILQLAVDAVTSIPIFRASMKSACLRRSRR